MSGEEVAYAMKVRLWQSVNNGFPILWVKGDYEKAEQSFLKINKTGRQLSPWETTLVESRRSSFARAVMSIAHVSDKEHCWPVDDPAVRTDSRALNQVAEILEHVEELHRLLFTPVYEKPIRQSQQPLLATPYTRPEIQPAWLAELLTITEGHRGQSPETRRLLMRDAKDPVPRMIATGHQLLRNARDVIENIAGPSPRSLQLMPLVYFYNTAGIFVRSLLYGMVYWLNRGTKTDILSRKRVFAAHRGAFEQVFLANKNSVIGRITRRIGSGPEVTYPTALYLDGLLRLLIEHKDAVDTQEFKAAHESLIERLSPLDAGAQSSEIVSVSRTYRGQARAAVVVPGFVDMFRICPVCDGRFYPNDATQIDHRVGYARGGLTSPSNGQETHPFCNNQKDVLEDLIAGRVQIDLPEFGDPKHLPQSEQLSFFSFLEAVEEDEQADSEEEGSEEDATASENGAEQEDPEPVSES
jgi:hypothetical protein